MSEFASLILYIYSLNNEAIFLNRVLGNGSCSKELATYKGKENMRRKVKDMHICMK